jgi:putative membrane protein
MNSYAIIVTVKPKPLLISVAVALAIAAFFVARVPLTPSMTLISSINVVLFALPSYYAVVRLRGKARGADIIGLLGLYALLIETSAINTGFPYGDFIYHDLLGSKLFDATPWTVAFAYPPILLLAYWMASRHITARQKISIAVLTALIATLIDAVLDPAAVRLGFWEWYNPGRYYGVPLVNFAGWLLTSFVGGLLLAWLLPLKSEASDSTRGLSYSGLAIVWFWTWINLWLGQWIPLAIGILVLAMIYRHLKSRRGTIEA